MMLILGLTFAFLSPTAANADPATKAPTWSTPLTDIAPARLYTSTDGSISGSACSSSASAVIGVDQSTGAIINEIASSSINGDRCILEHAVDDLGVSYVIERDSLYGGWPAYAGTTLAAYKNNTQLWVADLGVCQGGYGEVPFAPQSVEVGYDDGVYVIGTTLQLCSETDKLMKIDKQTGVVRYEVPLVNTWTDGSWVDRRMTAYKNGLVIADSNKLRYFNYSGAEDTAKTVTYDQTVVNHTVADNGGAVMTPIWSGGSCPDVTYNPGSATASNLTYSLNECNQGGVNMSSLPGGKFAYEYFDNGQQWSGNYNVKVFNVDGSVVYDKVVTPNGESGFPSNTRVVYDSSGKALVVQNEPNGKLSFEVFDTSGNSETYFEADGVTTSNNRLGPVTLSNGSAYVALCNTSCANSQMSQGSVLYKFDITGITPDYPRGYLLGDGPDKHQYVALGDSFSSGEGVSPYSPESMIDGTNNCHRSLFAYSKQLEQAMSLDYSLVNFRACSGATTWNVLNGQNNEPAQLTSINSTTDVVTLTIGGNDVGFKEFAAACVTGLCDEGSVAYNTALQNVNTILPTVLPNTYNQILDSLSEDADLYVLGYPHVAPEKSVTDLPPYPTTCPYLYNGNSGSGTDVVPNPWGNARGAFDITARINAHIESVVHDISLQDDRIHFIDVNEIGSPFAGHDVCSSDPYFANVNTDVPSIFHPNLKGQQALADILKAKLPS